MSLLECLWSVVEAVPVQPSPGEKTRIEGALLALGAVTAGPQQRTREELMGELAAVSGLELSVDADLSRLSTFRIGGRAEILAEATTEEALGTLLAIVEERGIGFLLVGIGSNLLFPDEGLEGIVARLGGEFREIVFDGTTVQAGGAVSLPKLVRAAARRGLVGLEALAGFPSSVGGAVHMNAGCYGTEIKDVLRSVRVLDRKGCAAVLSVAELGAGYRTTILQRTGQIVVRAVFDLERGDAAAAAARIEELNRRRWDSLPSGEPNVGSIFRNPPGDSAGRLIDACGLKGLKRGGAQISRKHGNVIVNTGEARAEDVLRLMVSARDAVQRRFGVRLEPEVVLTGSLAARWRSLSVASAEM